MTRRIVAVGCDVQACAPVAESLQHFGSAYLDRVLADGERERAASKGADVQQVTGLIAAKEAVMKCLDLRASDPLAWNEIVVEPSAAVIPSETPLWGILVGWRPVGLHGRAAEHARRRGISAVLVDRTAIARRHLGSRAASTDAAPGEPGSLRPDEPVEWCSARAVALGGRGRRGTAASAPEEPGRGSARSERLAREMGRETMSTKEEIVAAVRAVVAQHAHLSRDAASLGETESLYEAGMTSHASVNVMLGVEDAFDIEFPEDLLTKETFESLDSIAAAVQRLEDAS